MGSGCTSSYLISCNNFWKMSINVASGEVKFSVKLAVIFSYLLRLDNRLNFEFFCIKRWRWCSALTRSTLYGSKAKIRFTLAITVRLNTQPKWRTLANKVSNFNGSVLFGSFPRLHPLTIARVVLSSWYWFASMLRGVVMTMFLL